MAKAAAEAAAAERLRKEALDALGPYMEVPLQGEEGEDCSFIIRIDPSLWEGPPL